MKRVDILKALKARLNYYGRKGYDVESAKKALEGYSVQKLSALYRGKTGKQLIDIFCPAYKGETYEAAKAAKAAAADRERLSGMLGKKLKNARKLGIDINLSGLDVAAMNIDELRRAANASREELIRGYGGTVTRTVKAPGQSTKQVVYTGSVYYDYLAAARRRSLAAVREGFKAGAGRLYATSDEGLRRLIEGLTASSKKGMITAKFETMARNFIQAIKKWGTYIGELEYLGNELAKMYATDREKFLRILKENFEAGEKIYSIEGVYESGDIRMDVQKIYIAFEIKPYAGQ